VIPQVGEQVLHKLGNIAVAVVGAGHGPLVGYSLTLTTAGGTPAGHRRGKTAGPPPICKA